MSTGRDCYFEHFTDGWFYLLEGAYDDEYMPYGPFPTFASAERHLSDHHANPGGYSAPDEDGPAKEPNERQRWIIAEAAKNMAAFRGRGRY